jgi:hypothetical protein
MAIGIFIDFAHDDMRLQHIIYYLLYLSRTIFDYEMFLFLL